MEDGTQQLQELQHRIAAQDPAACFVQRERYLARVEQTASPEARQAPDFYAGVLAGLLAEADTPVAPEDIFVGRMTEAVLPDGRAPHPLLGGAGELSYDYARILKQGISGILRGAKRQALYTCDEEAGEYTRNGAQVGEAVHGYALRYAAAARAAGKERAAQALERVPYAPAYDLFSALQGIWLLHLVASCFVGGRDYAFGRTDRVLLPYYQRSLAAGETARALEEQLAAFLLKAGEICGRDTGGRPKPVPCFASRQTVFIGGAQPNPVSYALLRAYRRVWPARPALTVLLDETADPAFAALVRQTQAACPGGLRVVPYAPTRDLLLQKGMGAPLAQDYTLSADGAVDLHYNSLRQRHTVPTQALLRGVLQTQPTLRGAALREAYTQALCGEIRQYFAATPPVLAGEQGLQYNRRAFVLDGLFLGPCADRCRYPLRGGLVNLVYNLIFPAGEAVAELLAGVQSLPLRQEGAGVQKAALVQPIFLAAVRQAERELPTLPFQQRYLIPVLPTE